MTLYCMHFYLVLYLVLIVVIRALTKIEHWWKACINHEPTTHSHT